jgi:hypothetical protein
LRVGGEGWSGRRASVALVLAVIAVAGMPVFAHLAGALASVVMALAAHVPDRF